MMELKINSEDDVDLTLFLADGIFLKRSVTLDVALYSIEDDLVAAETTILNEIFCNSNSAVVTLPVREHYFHTPNMKQIKTCYVTRW